MAGLLIAFSGLSIDQYTEETRLSVSFSAMDLSEDICDAPSASTPCTEADCPIGHPHQQGVYRYQDKAPHKYSILLGESNSPPHVWESITNMVSGIDDREDVLAVEKFLRYHVPEKSATR